MQIFLIDTFKEFSNGVVHRLVDLFEFISSFDELLGVLPLACLGTGRHHHALLALGDGSLRLLEAWLLRCRSLGRNRTFLCESGALLQACLFLESILREWLLSLHRLLWVDFHSLY